MTDLRQLCRVRSKERIARAPRRGLATGADGKRGLLSLFIGWVFCLPQPVDGQDPNQLLVLDGEAREVTSGLRELLRGGPGEWRMAWRRARDIGPPLASVLWERVHREGNPQRRLLWLATYAAAAGGAAPSRWLEAEWQRAAGESDWLFALLALSVGPAVVLSDSAADVVVEVASTDSLRIAASAAWAPRAEPMRWPAEWLAGTRSQDPGLCAAALLCGGLADAAAVERWIAGRVPPDEAAQLVWRALLLASHDSPISAGRRLDIAQRAVRWEAEMSRALRRAATLHIGRTGQEEPWSERGPDSELLVLLGFSPNGRRAAYRAGWLEASPPQRLEPATRAKLAVLFVQAAKPEEVANAAATWAEDEELRGAVCLAIAWRRLVGDAGLRPGPWLEALDVADESAWPRLAFGELRDRGELGVRIERLGHPALALALQQRVTGRVLARAAEAELWLRDAHPGRDAHRCYVELVRDLLLSGSDYARAATGRAFPYLPSDLRPGDRGFFEIAVEFTDWLVEEATAVPAEYRLR